MDLLRELCETPGIPGREERLRTIVRRELEPISDTVRVDALGNLICAKQQPGAPKLMIAAHMDEIGFVVSHIENNKGWLRLVGLGGTRPTQYGCPARYRMHGRRRSAWNSYIQVSSPPIFRTKKTVRSSRALATSLWI